MLLERRCATCVAEVLDVQRCDQDEAQENTCARRIPELSEGSTAGDGVNRAHPRAALDNMWPPSALESAGAWRGPQGATAPILTTRGLVTRLSMFRFFRSILVFGLQHLHIV